MKLHNYSLLPANKPCWVSREHAPHMAECCLPPGLYWQVVLPGCSTRGGTARL
jgi:hypothetical protein